MDLKENSTNAGRGNAACPMELILIRYHPNLGIGIPRLGVCSSPNEALSYNTPGLAMSNVTRETNLVEGAGYIVALIFLPKPLQVLRRYPNDGSIHGPIIRSS